MTTGFIMYTYIDFPHQYGIFCRWVADVPSRETSLSGDERGETSAFRRLLLHISNTGHNVSSYITEEIIENIRSLAECGRIFSPALQIQRTRKAFQIQDSDYYWCLLLSLQTAWSWLPLYSNYLVLASQLWAKSRGGGGGGGGGGGPKAPPPPPPPHHAASHEVSRFHSYDTYEYRGWEPVPSLGVSSDVVAKDFNFVAFVTLRHISSTSFLFF